MGLLAAAVAAGACGRDSTGGQAGGGGAPKLGKPSDALRPDFFAAAIRRMGGAHFHGTLRMAVAPASGGAAVSVRTTTDAWVDRTGNYRLREDNDRDGGREVVLTGRELAVALRYGRMIRRVAEEPEPARILEEGLAAPWAVYELVAPQAHFTRAGGELMGGAKATVFELSLGKGERAVPARGATRGRTTKSAGDIAGLAAWRDTAKLEKLAGRIVVDDATGALVKSDLAASFTAKAQDGPVKGEMEVHTFLTDVATTPPIARPPAEDLTLRQRIVPEQKELLRGIAQTHPVVEAPPARRVGARGHKP